MSVCSECFRVLEELDLNILEETEELQGELNAREYTCPYCLTTLRIYIKVDFIETIEKGEK